jgi:hypothetical protein
MKRLLRKKVGLYFCSYESFIYLVCVNNKKDYSIVSRKSLRCGIQKIYQHLRRAQNQILLHKLQAPAAAGA